MSLMFVSLTNATFSGMTNHEQHTLDHLAAVDNLEKRLTQEYAQPHPRPGRVAELHQQINRRLKKADIHAMLAVRQELQDLAAVLR